MTIEQIKEMVNGHAYDFLRTNPHLTGRIMFLTLGGSYAYGTNIETSDVDIRGCAMNSKSDLLGLTDFEQVVNTQTDTTIYGFNKLVSLLLNCNPNTIELLGCKPEHYFYISDAGQSMIDNRKLFLSKRAANSFGGYATQQLRRLGIAYSFPVPSQDAFGNLIDCFFLYDIDYQTGQAQPPYARIGIYAEHKQLAFYYTSKEFPFTQKEEPAHSALILDFSEKDSQEYEQLYPEIRSTAFSKTIDTGEKQLLSAYCHVATSLFGVQHQYYNDIAPAFFVWMNQMLQETPPSKSFLDATGL